ncbi:MAG: hypothetical protein J7K83_00450 [Candidatus Aenigmarchaeota archaeon]|nr:hypothetical protein [Candidatus Aenigmarchaeota archaeon]
MSNHRSKLLRRDPVLDKFANYIYDHGYEWFLGFLKDYEITSDLRCNVCDRFGRFKYELK